jgi:hypothetical protein
MRSHAIAAAILAGVIGAPAMAHAQTKSADQAFVSGGKVDIHLDAGDYEVRAASDNHVRVTMTGRTGSATVDVAVDGRHADVTVRHTSRTSFKCIVEVPKISDVAIRLSAGDLDVGTITGSKDIQSTAGDVRIAVGNLDEYANVDASVSVGDLSGGPFGDADGQFISHSIKKTGKGKHTFRVHLGAGDLKLD